MKYGVRPDFRRTALNSVKIVQLRKKEKRLKRKMKRSKLRKRSKSKVTLDIADRKLQDWYRKNYPDDKCEVCGAIAEVRHHHLEKSKSNAGRFNYDNLIALCHKCHSKITFGDNNIVATYSLKRGAEWLSRMKKLRQEKKQYYTKGELEKIIKKYQ